MQNVSLSIACRSPCTFQEGGGGGGQGERGSLCDLQPIFSSPLGVCPLASGSRPWAMSFIPLVRATLQTFEEGQWPAVGAPLLVAALGWVECSLASDGPVALLGWADMPPSAAFPTAFCSRLAAASAQRPSQVLSYFWGLSARETQGQLSKANPGVRPSTWPQARWCLSCCGRTRLEWDTPWGGASQSQTEDCGAGAASPTALTVTRACLTSPRTRGHLLKDKYMVWLSLTEVLTSSPCGEPSEHGSSDLECWYTQGTDKGVWTFFSR